MRSLALVFLSSLAFGALASDKESDAVFLKCDIKNEKTGEQRVRFFNIGKSSYGIPYWREFNFGLDAWRDVCQFPDNECTISDHIFRWSWDGRDISAWEIDRHTGGIRFVWYGGQPRDPSSGACSVGKPPQKESRKF